MTVNGTASVLLVEDNPGDVRLVREAFEEIDHQADLTVETDGKRALERLRSDPSPPSLVLLDLHLPGCAGDDVLEELKADPSLRRVPVVIFSDSNDKEDVRQMYDLHANAYVTKPQDMDQYVSVVEQLTGFWLSTARLSPEVADG